MSRNCNATTTKGVNHSTGPLHVLQVTDTHLFANAGGTLYQANTRKTLNAVLQDIRAHPWKPDLILATGDLVHDGSMAGYEALARLLTNLGAPVCCLPGNHDGRAALQKVLGGQTDSPVIIGNWQLILLDTLVEGKEYGELSAGNLEHLESALNKQEADYSLICLHHHPVAVGCRWLDRIALRNSIDLFRILAAHNSAKGLVWGHIHQRFDGYHRLLKLMGTPSTCVQFLPGQDTFALDTLPPAYRRLELMPDGRINTTIRWLDKATV